jgi:hypothetical protein
MISSMVNFTSYKQTHRTHRLSDQGHPGAAQEVRNERALFVYNRVQNKITGNVAQDFQQILLINVRTRFQS